MTTPMCRRMANKDRGVEEDTLVGASVLLSCGPYQEIYDFSFCLCPSPADSKEGLLRQIQKSIRDQSRESGDIVLPEEVARYCPALEKGRKWGWSPIVRIRIACMFSFALWRQERKGKAEGKDTAGAKERLSLGCR